MVEHRVFLAGFLGACLFHSVAQAEDIICFNSCKSQTHSHEIVEEDMRKRIEREVRSVDWSRVNKKLKEDAQRKIKNFSEVYEFYTPQEDVLYFFDPSVEATNDVWGYDTEKLFKTQDMSDAIPKIVVAKGTKVNPLDHMKVHQKLFIFNPKAFEQVQLAKKIAGSASGKRMMFIGTKGDLNGVAKKIGRHVYYLNSQLQNRLGLKTVPTIVDTENKHIRIRSYSFPFSFEKIKPHLSD